MSFFANIHETQIFGSARRPFFPVPPAASAPMHRRLFPLEQSATDIARAAVREVLG